MEAPRARIRIPGWRSDRRPLSRGSSIPFFLARPQARAAANAPGSRPFFPDAGGFRGKHFDRTLRDASPVLFRGSRRMCSGENRLIEGRLNGSRRLSGLSLTGKTQPPPFFQRFPRRSISGGTSRCRRRSCPSNRGRPRASARRKSPWPWAAARPRCRALAGRRKTPAAHAPHRRRGACAHRFAVYGAMAPISSRDGTHGPQPIPKPRAHQWRPRSRRAPHGRASCHSRSRAPDAGVCSGCVESKTRAVRKAARARSGAKPAKSLQSCPCLPRGSGTCAKTARKFI